MEIGNKIKQLREEKGLSQEELAEKMGYKSKSTINKIEMGKNDISQTKVVEYASVFGVTPAYLMGYEDVRNNELDFDTAIILKELSTHTKLLNEIWKSEKLIEHIDKLAELKDKYKDDIYNIINDLHKK